MGEIDDGYEISAVHLITIGAKVLVSLNPIMIDGTGMCGGCRVTVGEDTKFACVDGPCFDGALIDWDEMIARLGTYAEEEKIARDHYCECKKARKSEEKK